MLSLSFRLALRIKRLKQEIHSALESQETYVLFSWSAKKFENVDTSLIRSYAKCFFQRQKYTKIEGT